MAITVTAAIIIKDDKILITRRASHKHLGGYWEFPGGKIEPNETLEDCLKREILEELNIQIQVDSFFSENEHHYSNVSVLLKAYLCTFISGSIKLIDHDKFDWVEKKQLLPNNFAPADVPFVKLLKNGMSNKE